MKKFQAENRLKQYSQIQQISVEKPTPLLLPRPVPFGPILPLYRNVPAVPVQRPEPELIQVATTVVQVPVEKPIKRETKVKPRAYMPRVRIACTHCFRQHKRCSETRPCSRCIYMGRAATCTSRQTLRNLIGARPRVGEFELQQAYVKETNELNF